jgi:hypothetical protein
MRPTLADFARDPYYAEALAAVIDSDNHRWRSLASLAQSLPPTPVVGAVHLVTALGLLRGRLERDGERYRVAEDDQPPVTLRVSVPPGTAPRGVGVSGRTYWQSWADGQWWLLTPGEHHRNPVSGPASNAARAWGRAYDRATQVCIPGGPSDPWLVRFVPTGTWRGSRKPSP